MLRAGNSSTVVELLRDRLLISGRVQGVGFRPFVYRLARELHLTGQVANTSAGVCIDVQGPADAVAAFTRRLTVDHPPAAMIHRVDVVHLPVQPADETFLIAGSDAASVGRTEIAADLAICPDCLREIRHDEDARRGSYGLSNCTACGPRFSIIRRTPYDRPQTTMASFAMCPACAGEYADPADRRFHAQPTACRACGPSVWVADARGEPVQVASPYAAAAERLLAGDVVAIKGVGGFHLAVRADDTAAVNKLRQAKHRLHKPLAVMAADIDLARRLARFSDRGLSLLQSPAAPIVIAPRLPGSSVVPAVSGASDRLGVMLPYTPIHHLIFDASGGRLQTLVMTSGNDSDEPLAIDNADAIARLQGMADWFVLHDRDIERPIDDSVLLDVPGDEPPMFLRRSRGFVPSSLPLPAGCESVGLCVGGELKNTVAVVRGGEVIVSQHVGDLVNARTYASFRKVIADLLQLFKVQPEWVARDAHPAYLSSKFAAEFAKEHGLPCVAVQHHFAHAASALAETGRSGPALAVVCDGTGFGLDDTTWGGELLAFDLGGFQRLARLRPLRLLGGDASAKAPWRSAVSVLHQALGDGLADHPATKRLVPDQAQRRFVAQALRQGTGCTQSSSTGRWFDAVAALLGLCSENHFEAEAAMTLEAAAAGFDAASPGTLSTVSGQGLQEIDLSPFAVHLLDSISKRKSTGELAAAFHETLAGAWEAAVCQAAERTKLETVVLSGGCFANARLRQSLSARLTRRGLEVLQHRLVPANDGGLSLGQAAVAGWAFNHPKARPVCA